MGTFWWDGCAPFRHIGPIQRVPMVPTRGDPISERASNLPEATRDDLLKRGKVFPVAVEIATEVLLYIVGGRSDLKDIDLLRCNVVQHP